MSPLIAELLGTALLVLLGDGVVANVVLKRTKGHDGGWIVITAGWGFAVAIAVYCVGSISGAHLNPAVTIGLARSAPSRGTRSSATSSRRSAGGFLGATIVWITYRPHFAATPDPASKLGVFCTAPAIRHSISNVLTEIVGTFVLVLGILAVLSPANLTQGSEWSRGFGPALVGLIVWSIGLSLGGPTGYAINPARDFGPRLAHAVLPIAGKGGSDWGYALVPIIGPIIGGVLGALCYRLIWT